LKSIKNNKSFTLRNEAIIVVRNSWRRLGSNSR
jgi:hypothetical protein